MLVQRTKEDLQRWKSEMNLYEKVKRTKKPCESQFGFSSENTANFNIHQKERIFNPVLQVVSNGIQKKDKQNKQKSLLIDSQNKYYAKVGMRNFRDYDIITLQQSEKDNEKSRKPHKSLAPVRNIYNPINNEMIPKHFYQNKKVILPTSSEFKKRGPPPRDFNIVTGNYLQDNQIKKLQQNAKQNKLIHQKYQRTHEYDKVYGRFYNPQLQRIYDEQRSQSELKHSNGQQYNKRFPPVYLTREPVVLDTTRPLPQSLILYDIKKQNAKRRYKLKYLLENQYQKRNIQYQQKKQAMALNRIHNSKSFSYEEQFPLKQSEAVVVAKQLPKIKQQIQNWNQLSKQCNPEVYAFSENFNRQSENRCSSSIKSEGFA